MIYKSINRLAWLVCVLSCIGCQWDVGTIDLRLVYSAINGEDHDPFRSAVRMRIRVEGKNIGLHIKEFDVDKAGRLTNIPIDQRVRITVETLNSIGQPLARGISDEIETGPGENRIYLFIGRRRQFSDPPVFGLTDKDWVDRYRTNMIEESGRAFHTTSLLPNGELLIIGGTQVPAGLDILSRLGQALRSAERFDPTSCSFLVEGQQRCSTGEICLKAAGLAHHTVDTYPGRNELMVVGGEPISNGPEIFDLSSLTFHSAGFRLKDPRSRHTLTSFSDPNIGLLVAGGFDEGGSLLSTIELLEPDSGHFLKLTAEMATPRAGAVSVAYEKGILIIGGWERFDAWEQGIPTRVASNKIDRIRIVDGKIKVDSIGPLIQARAQHTATLIKLDTPDGEQEAVFVCGGLTNAIDATDTCELIDPEKGLIIQQSTILGARWSHTATLLEEGLVLIAGGFFGGAPSPAARQSAYLVDPDGGDIRDQQVSMISPRAGHTATRLPNGMVVLIGGMASGTEMASTDYEIFVP